MTKEDLVTMEWVTKFQKFDLYTKDDNNELQTEKLWPYYSALVEKYLGSGPLKW